MDQPDGVFLCSPRAHAGTNASYNAEAVVGFGTLYAAAPAGNEWTINHYLLAKSGVSLEGPDFNTLIPLIDIRDVRIASARDLLTEWAPKIDDFSWLSSSHHQSYLVLNLCRILHTAIGGETGSKKIAGLWAKTTYPRWKDLIEEAESWAYGDVMKRQDDVVAFVRFAIERVNETNLLP